jgi:hypothetical protein
MQKRKLKMEEAEQRIKINQTFVVDRLLIPSAVYD